MTENIMTFHLNTVLVDALVGYSVMKFAMFLKCGLLINSLVSILILSMY